MYVCVFPVFLFHVLIGVFLLLIYDLVGVLLCPDLLCPDLLCPDGCRILWTWQMIWKVCDTACASCVSLS